MSKKLFPNTKLKNFLQHWNSFLKSRECLWIKRFYLKITIFYNKIKDFKTKSKNLGYFYYKKGFILQTCGFTNNIYFKDEHNEISKLCVCLSTGEKLKLIGKIVNSKDCKLKKKFFWNNFQTFDKVFKIVSNFNFIKML